MISTTDISKGVFRVATAIVDLSLVPEKEFKTMYSPEGRIYYDLSYDIELSVQSSMEMYISIKGKRYGDKLTAAYE